MTTTQHQLHATLHGANVAELVEAAKVFIAAHPEEAATATRKTTSKKAAKIEVDEEPMGFGAEDETDEDTEAGFDGTADEDQEDEEVEEKPKAKKAAKITDKDVNAAAMAHAKSNGRPKTLALLQKQFKVKSILELKPEQYPAVMKALKV